MGLAFNLEEDSVSVPILGDFTAIHEDDEVRTTGRIIQAPVGDELIGRVVNALGEPLDDGGPINAKKFRPVERVAPGVITRHPVDTPVQTGLKAIDALIPIGRGQRELIIGDRQTGKTAVAIDTIINQKGKDLICVYVSIGQKNFQIARIRETLRQYGALEHTIIVHAGAEDPAPLKYLAPGPRGVSRRCVLPAQSPAGARCPPEQRLWWWLADGAADHRDEGQRRVGVHPDQRHLHHRRPDLPGD
jgi:F-type H+-transporting ATPase subunit alpha